MSPSLILPPLLLCIFLLLQIVSSHDQSPSKGGNPTAAAANQTAPPLRAAPNFQAHEFLVAHNKVRKNVSHPLFTWDNKLVRYARRWGMKRANDCALTHSFSPYGENMFRGTFNHWTPTEAVESWANESKHYNRQYNSCARGEMCGHYTQLIWRDSVKLGCTRVQCQNGGVLMICEYDPPGNYINESPFDNVNTPAAVPNKTATVPSPPSTVLSQPSKT